MGAFENPYRIPAVKPTRAPMSVEVYHLDVRPHVPWQPTNL